MIKSIKVMLCPNKKQLTKLFQYAGAARFAYNWALEKEMDCLSGQKRLLSDTELRKEFTQLKKQEKYQWLNKISNNVPKQAIKDLWKAYQRFFQVRKQKGYKPYSKKFLEHMARIEKVPTFYQSNGHPKFKSKKNFEAYGFYQDNVKIKFTSSHVKVEGFASSKKKKNKQKLNYIRLAEQNRIPTDCKYSNPRITYDGLHWWISVGVEVPESPIMLQKEGIGIDLGVKELAICSDGNTYKTSIKRKRSRDWKRKNVDCNVPSQDSMRKIRKERATVKQEIL